MTKDVANIWADFHQELKGFIYNKTRSSADTDDILQDAFIKTIWRRSPDLCKSVT